jgi:hypothetical protein
MCLPSEIPVCSGMPVMLSGNVGKSAPDPGQDAEEGSGKLLLHIHYLVIVDLGAFEADVGGSACHSLRDWGKPPALFGYGDPDFSLQLTLGPLPLIAGGYDTESLE